MKTKTLSPELLHKIDACWHAANYLSGGRPYLYDNPLLKRPWQCWGLPFFISFFKVSGLYDNLVERFCKAKT